MAACSSAPSQSVQALPSLPPIRIDSDTLFRVREPAKCIHAEADVQRWQSSAAYSIFLLFVSRLSQAVVGKPTSADLSSSGKPSNIAGILRLLETLQQWIEEIPPKQGPQRFGNLAFRDWGARLDSQLGELHQTLIPSEMHLMIPELSAYLGGGFGSYVRIDYGSGHEMSFLAWLCLLYRLGFVKEEDEEPLVLTIFAKYLEVVWTLQDRYGLEPAGSHGVWGLDDFQFLPYVFGAAQLQNTDNYRPPAVASASSHPSPTQKDPLSLLRFSPSDLRPVFPNLYSASIARIHALKRGPFAEHSPILNDIAHSVPNWRKVHSGMVKMYAAECLGKRPVVQHFPFGGLGFVWDEPSSSSAAVRDNNGADRNSQRNVTASVSTSGTSALGSRPVGNMAPQSLTAAPWAAQAAQTSAVTTPSVVHPSRLNPAQKNPSAGYQPSTAAPWASGGGSSTARPPPGQQGAAPLRAIPGVTGPLPPAHARDSTLASTGSAAAASSPFGSLPPPSAPSSATRRSGAPRDPRSQGS